MRQDVEGFYKAALDLDPLAIEVTAQWAQLKSMILSDFAAAASLLRSAIPFSRSVIYMHSTITVPNYVT